MRTKRTITRGLIWTGFATWLWAFLSVLAVGMFAVSASAATFTVTSTGDVSDPQAGDGSCGWPKSSPFYAIYSAIYPCTLRAALEEVNAQRPGTGPHTINFSIGYGNQTISLTNALPRIMQPVVIDGGTQPVYVRNVLSTTLAPCSSIGHPCIQLNGNGRLGSVLTLAAGNSTVRWLAIYNYDTGISITSDNDLIEASYIGTDASGVSGPGGLQDTGVAVTPSPGYSAANTVIRNSLISGNRLWGVLLQGSGVRNNQLLGNFIGTTVDGSAALFPSSLDCNNTNPTTGVFIGRGASNNMIGSNLISGNCDGVVIDATGLTDPNSPTTALRTFNQVLGNRIGTDATGWSPVPNRLHGVLINNASSNLVATTASGTPNQISWNHYFGVTISTTNQGISASDNKVLSNNIGPRNEFGVFLSGFVAGTAISGNVVGGNSWGIYVNSVNMPTDPTASQHNFVQNNTASNNKYYGIWMDHGAIGNTVQTNTALGNAVYGLPVQMTADLADDNINVSPCANTWINNTFVSASGFGASCIH